MYGNTLYPIHGALVASRLASLVPTSLIMVFRVRPVSAYMIVLDFIVTTSCSNCHLYVYCHRCNCILTVYPSHYSLCLETHVLVKTENGGNFPAILHSPSDEIGE